MPFWRKGLRSGRIRVTLSNLLSAEDLKALDAQEINSRIDSRLSGDDASGSADAKTAPPSMLHVFRAKKLAEGLENILYWCPSCGQEHTLQSNGNMLSCAICGDLAEMDKYARLNPAAGMKLPESIHEWNKKQAEHTMQSQLGDMAEVELARVKVNLRMNLSPGKGLETCGSGELSLESSGWRYDGELSGRNVQLHFPIDTVPAIPFDPDDNFQIYSKGSFYAFTPTENRRACAKYAMLGELAYWRFATDVQMTKRPCSS